MSGDIAQYREINRQRLSLQANWETFRFVCIDSESTGFDPRKDRLVSIAGIAVQNGEIQGWDAFSVIVPVAYNTSAVTVHGITREESAEGVEEPEALARLAGWLRDGVIVGHHIQHDLILLNTAFEKHHQLQLRNVAVDTMAAFLAVAEAGGFAALGKLERFSLDALCERFHIVPHDRHTAHGDAFLTAQLLLRVLKEAGKLGQWNLSDLRAWYADQPFPE
jgi:DNA polymerase-3 subunit epsilon